MVRDEKKIDKIVEKTEKLLVTLCSPTDGISETTEIVSSIGTLIPNAFPLQRPNNYHGDQDDWFHVSNLH